MMYSPNHYKGRDRELIFELIHKYSFGTHISAGPELMISHLPFLLELDSDGTPKLISHMARMNPQWKMFSENSKEKILFQGPNSYISPEWYAPAEDNVPTWNYAVVHVTGRPVIVNDKTLALEAMNKLIAAFEKQTETNWSLPQPYDNEIHKLMEHIVVYEIHDLAFEAKFKLSQRETPENRKTTMAELKKLGREASREIATLMERVSLK